VTQHVLRAGLLLATFLVITCMYFLKTMHKGGGAIFFVFFETFDFLIVLDFAGNFFPLSDSFSDESK